MGQDGKAPGESGFGFSLLFRDRQVLLRLEGRALAPGVLLEHCEAALWGVTLPFRAPASLTAYRHNLCTALDVGMQVELDSVRAWLTETLRKQWVESLRCETAEVLALAGDELDGDEPERDDRSGPAVAGRPQLALRLAGRDGRGSWSCIVIPLGLGPDGTVVPSTWHLGLGDAEVAEPLLAHRIAHRLGLDARGPHALLERLLAREFACHGWKAPAFSQLVLTAVENDHQSLRLSWRTGPSEATTPPPDPSPPNWLVELASKLAASRHLLHEDLVAGVEQLEMLAEDVARRGMPRLALDLRRWIVERLRHVAGHDADQHESLRARRRMILERLAAESTDDGEARWARIRLFEVSVDDGERTQALDLAAPTGATPPATSASATAPLPSPAPSADSSHAPPGLNSSHAPPGLNSSHAPPGLNSAEAAESAPTPMSLQVLWRRARAAGNAPGPWLALANACAEAGDAQGEATARREQAVRLLQSGAVEQALAALARAVRRRPQDPALRLTYAETLAQAKQHRGAAEAYLGLLEAFEVDVADLGPPFGRELDHATLLDRAIGLIQSAGSPAELLERLLALLAEGDPRRDDIIYKLGETVREEPPEQRVDMFLRLAALTQEDQHQSWLEHAMQTALGAKDDDLVRAVLEQAPDNDALRELWVETLREQERLDEAAPYLEQQASSGPLVKRAAALRQLIALQQGDRSLSEVLDEEGRCVELCERLLAVAPDESDVAIALAEHANRRGRREAGEYWQRVLDHVEPTDVRHDQALLGLASHYLAHGEYRSTRPLLERLLERYPNQRTALTLLRRTADELGDVRLAITAREGLLSHTEDAQDKARLTLELARLHSSVGEQDQALHHIRSAARFVTAGSELHVEIAEAWIGIARDIADDPSHEADARAQLRAALGDRLPAVDVRAEALLWTKQLGQPEHAFELLERALENMPNDDLLLSTFKDVAHLLGTPSSYRAALERALLRDLPSSDRMRLVLELATTAAHREDPRGVLDALRHLQGMQLPLELADLRQWALTQTGEGEREREHWQELLRANPSDAGVLETYVSLFPSGRDAANDLIELSHGLLPERAEDPLRRAARLAVEDEDHLLLVRVLRESASAPLLPEFWDVARELALAASDAAAVSDLLTAATSSPELSAARDRLLDESLARMPDAPHLHRVLWASITSSAADDTSRLELAVARLDQIARAHALDPERHALLYVAASDELERHEAAPFLSRAAAASPEAYHVFVDALVERNFPADALRLLEQQTAVTVADPVRLAAHRRLAHIYGELLGDGDAAIHHLEAGLALRPDDPDLLLPLLDHHFEQRDLSRALDLTQRALDVVPMGDAAFLSLVHRAADAAVAQGEPDRALALLSRGLERVADDRRTTDRIGELQALQSSPEHRARLLGLVAQRQTGQARFEALEERARLLVDPLGRIDEAIDELESVVAEAPERQQALSSLRTLYERRDRWGDIVGLLEREFPRLHGVARCRALQNLAAIYRDKLLDHPRAEQALRLALEHLSEDPEHQDFGEELRLELARDLETQGRYVDLSIYLDRALRPELLGEVEAAQLHPIRADLLVMLARVYRGPLDDESRATRVYERLEAMDRLPDEGLGTLARAYHRTGRHEDLARVLRIRANSLEAAGDVLRKAAVDLRLAELLEGPLCRPHEAADLFVEAYLADPQNNGAAGERARLLLTGLDAVRSTRARLLARRSELPPDRRAVMLALLGDLLAPHEEHEAEAEAYYREALELQPDLVAPQESLGRLLARQGRLEDAIGPLLFASRHAALDPQRSAENAAIAARALALLDRAGEAEEVLQQALQRAPDSQRALLELARLYERSGRATQQAFVLETLSQLPLSSMLKAEVAFRRAMLLHDVQSGDPLSASAEQAHAHLLEAVGADAKHVAARQALLELAAARGEWSVVAHMHYLAIRDLPAGPTRALVHLDLAETYLTRLDDIESAIRNIESAMAQAADDAVAFARALRLAGRLPDPRRVADRVEKLAAAPDGLDDAARARLWLLAADLRMLADDPSSAEADTRRVLSLEDVPREITTAAARSLVSTEDEAELVRQKSGLLRLLDAEDQAAERLHILGRLREIGQSLRDGSLIEWASREELSLAEQLEAPADIEAASSALRDLFIERGSHEELVALFERLGDRTADRERSGGAFAEAARFAWRGLRDATRAARLIRQALERHPSHDIAILLSHELPRAVEDPDQAAAAFEELSKHPADQRTPTFTLDLAALAERARRFEEAAALLQPLFLAPLEPALRDKTLRQLDHALAQMGQAAQRVPVLRRLLEHAESRSDAETATVALDLARLQISMGDFEGARRSSELGLARDPKHQGLLTIAADSLERLELWPELTALLQRLLELTTDKEERARLRMRIAHGWSHVMQRATAEVQVLQASNALQNVLREALKEKPEHVEALRTLIPLVFDAGHWRETLALAREMRKITGDDEEGLLLAALCEAFVEGRRDLAREIGYRHDPTVLHRSLYPALVRVLDEVATAGPLPRLDPVLASASAVLGGRRTLTRGLRSWLAGRPPSAGSALALARLDEADGKAEPARFLYQLAAFLAKDGPLLELVDRLPQPKRWEGLDLVGDATVGGPRALRVALGRLGRVLAGLRRPSSDSPPPTLPIFRARLHEAKAIVVPWQRQLGLELPVLWSASATPSGLTCFNTAEPAIVVTPGVEQLSAAEFRYRLAERAITIAMGLALLDDPEGMGLLDLLDALTQVANPAHSPTGAAARVIGQHMLARGSMRGMFDIHERAALGDELSYWLSASDGVTRLWTELARVRRLLATRLSGQLLGALQAIARDTGRKPTAAFLELDAPQWLLRALELD